MNSAYLVPLMEKFEQNKVIENAGPMAKYMKNHFEFLGLKSPVRKETGRDFFKQYGLPETENLEIVIKELWEMPYREYQYFAQEILIKFINKSDKKTIGLLEYMITTKSWWDTVDLIASNLVGPLFLKYPELIVPYTNKWMDSGNMWLQRTAILFQLKYKDKTDFELLTGFIYQLSSSNEFFIQKAIGWILREYSKTNADTVVEFVQNNKLAKLSEREALKWLQNR